ncbi:DUF1127 domain-containing protein [uncultured Roseibium sp.]|uniref:DUF1127 domain-containing protein n=1 Tax=uncultured Roseibium sp. TaxID=1936171 RepID=UPI003216FD88
MAATTSSSVMEHASHAFSATGKGILAFFEEFGRARAARALYTELSAMSDAELDSLGLVRSDISRKVYAKVYDRR